MPAEMSSTLGSNPNPTIGLPASSPKPFSGTWSGRCTSNSFARMNAKNLPNPTNWSSGVLSTPTRPPMPRPTTSAYALRMASPPRL